MVALEASDASKSLGFGWNLQGPVLLRRLWTFHGNSKKACRAGQELAKVARVLASEDFRHYLQQVTGLELSKTQTSQSHLWIRCFRPGVHYERPSCTSNAQLDVLLTFDTLGKRRKGRRSRLGGADVYAEKDAGERCAEAAGVLNGPEAVPNAPEDWTDQWKGVVFKGVWVVAFETLLVKFDFELGISGNLCETIPFGSFLCYSTLSSSNRPFHPTTFLSFFMV